MAMNREQKRAMQKSGQQFAEDGTPVREKRDPTKRVRESRTSPMQFMREVRIEMRKVAWPTREETIRLSIIVFFAILILGTFIFFADIAFGQVNDLLFPTPSTASAVSSVSSLFF